MAKHGVALFYVLLSITRVTSLAFFLTSPPIANYLARGRINTVSEHSRENKASIETTTCHHSALPLRAAPEGALPDIVIPSILNIPGWMTSVSSDDDEEEDPRVWVPQTECLSFRPLCFCVSQGYYVNLLKFRGGGILGRHRHSSPVHALTLKGSWGYKEHGWHAAPGTYVFEPPGETHTLVVDEDCDEMVAMFHVTGSLLYVDELSGDVTGYDDVFTKLKIARAWYEECGLGREYAEQFVR